MPAFRYQGYTADGKRCRGRVEALDPKQARETLHATGVFVRGLAPVSSSRRPKQDLRSRGTLYRELAALQRAGMPLDRSLKLLAENPELGASGDSLAAVRDAVREGNEFSEAMASHMSGLREHEKAVLQSGEKTGRMAEVCEELADVLDSEADVREKIRSATTYPLIVVVLAVIALVVVVTVLLPTYGKLLGSLDQELPALTKGMLAFGDAARHPAGLVIFIAAIASFVWAIRGVVSGTSARWDRLRFRLPVLGSCFAHLARVRFARTLALLSEGRVAIHQAFRIAGAATGSTGIRMACETRAKEIEQGGRIADAVRGIPVLNVDLPGWLEAAEAGGDIPGMLRHAARGHQRAWERKVQQALALLEPILIVGVGLLILLVALSVLLPMLKVNRSLGA